MERLAEQKWLILAILALSQLASIPVTIGLILSQHISVSPILCALLHIFISLICGFAIASIVYDKKPLLIRTHEPDKYVAFVSKLSPTWNTKSIAIHATIMLLCWIPWMLFFFPGTMNWDTYYQIIQCYPQHETLLQIPWYPTQSWIPNHFSDHHPILDTLIFGSFAYLSDLITGSWNCGIFAYSFLQCCAMCISFSILCAYSHRLGLSNNCIAVFFLFFCLFPVFPAYGITMLKDSLFSWIFLLFFIATIEVVLTKGSCLNSKKRFVLYVAIVLLVCLSKKTGFYIVLICAITMLVIYRHNWRPFLTIFLAPIIVMTCLLPFIVFPVLDVAPGGRQEAIGMLFQQTARVATICDDATADEIQAIDKVLPYEKLPMLYSEKTADPVKNNYRWNSATTNDLFEYFRAWISQGLRHPVEYLKATTYIVAPYFDPYEPIGLVLTQGSDVSSNAKFHSLDCFETDREKMKAYYDNLSNTPLVRLFFSNVLYCWLIPIICMGSIVLLSRRSKSKNKSRSNGGYAYAFLPILAIVCMCIVSYLIAPVMTSRYALPLLYITPAIIGLTAYSKRECLDGEENQTQG